MVRRGKKSKHLDNAIQKTLEAIQEELKEIEKGLSKELDQLPADREIFNYYNPFHHLSSDHKKTVFKVIDLVERLILKGKGGFFLCGIPDYDYRTECFRDVPEAIKKHSQTSEAVKQHPAIDEIKRFFTLDFIDNEIKKEFINKEIDQRDQDWVG